MRRSVAALLLCVVVTVALAATTNANQFYDESDYLPVDQAPMSLLEAEAYALGSSVPEAIDPSEVEGSPEPPAVPAVPDIVPPGLAYKPMPKPSAKKGGSKAKASKKGGAKKKQQKKKKAPKKQRAAAKPAPLPRMERDSVAGLTPLHKIDDAVNEGLRAFHAIGSSNAKAAKAKQLDWYESFMKGEPGQEKRLTKHNKYGIPLNYRVRSIDGKAKHFKGESDVSPRPLVGRGSSAAYALHRILDTSFEDDLRGDIPNVHFPMPKVAPFASFTVKEVRPLEPEIPARSAPALPEEHVAAGMDAKRVALQHRLVAQLEYVNTIVPAVRAAFTNVYERVNKERSEMATEYQSIQDWMKEQKKSAEEQLSAGKKNILELRKKEIKLRDAIYAARKRAEKLKKWKVVDKAEEVLAERKKKKMERATLRRDLNKAIDWYNDAYTHTTNWLTYQAKHLTRHFKERQLYARRLAALARRIRRVVVKAEHLREQYTLHQERNVLEQQIHSSPESFELRVKWEQLGKLMDGSSRGDAPTRWNWVTHPEARYPGFNDAERQIDLGDVKLSKADAARVARLRGEEDTSRYGEQFGDREGEAVVQINVDPRGVSRDVQEGVKGASKKKGASHKKGGKKGGKKKKSKHFDRNAALRQASKEARRAFNAFFISPGANTKGELAPPPTHDDANRAARAMPFDGNYGTKGFLFHHHHHLHFPNASSFLEHENLGAMTTEEDDSSAPAAAAQGEAAPVTSVNSYTDRHAHHVHHYDMGRPSLYRHHMHIAPGSMWHYGTGYAHGGHFHHHHYSPAAYRAFHVHHRVAKHPVYLHEDVAATSHKGAHPLFEHNHHALNSHRYVGPEPGSYFHPGHGHFHKRVLVRSLHPLLHTHRHLTHLGLHHLPHVHHARLLRLTVPHHHHHHPLLHRHRVHSLHTASHYVQHDNPYSSHTRHSEAYYDAHGHLLAPNTGFVTHHIMAPSAPLRPVLPPTPYIKPAAEASSGEASS